MAKIENVVAFGKIFFIPTHEAVPPLPKMNLLFLKEDERGEIYPWRAICIDLEIDAVGSSKSEAWENLKSALTIYIDLEKNAAGGAIIETAKRIINTAFILTEQKKEYLDIYRMAKMQYTIGAIESGSNPNPIKEARQQYEKLDAIEEPIRYATNDVPKAA
jgi:hypothetical protein